MDKREQRYVELCFESFAKQTINNAITDGRREQEHRAKLEVCFSALPEKILLTLSTDSPEAAEPDEPPTKFRVKDFEISVHDPRLGQALRFLPPKDRAIVLLSYFLNMRDGEIGEVLDISRSTVQRRRTAAHEKLQYLLKNLP